MSETLIRFTCSFQDTKVFGGTVPQGHENDGLDGPAIAKAKQIGRIVAIFVSEIRFDLRLLVPLLMSDTLI